MAAAGDRIGPYVLDHALASGGMGKVFLARKVGAADFTRVVCVKQIIDHRSDDEDLKKRFTDEARIGSRLRHRNIVTVEDFVEEDGQLYLVMEFINGKNLAALEKELRARTVVFPADAGTFVAWEVLAALRAAHTARGTEGESLDLVHRDVSPSNVLVSYSGEVKLTDFGIARAAGQQHVTEERAVVGKFAYMPLEQLRGGIVDGRADLFALGVTLFELLTRVRPFGGSDPNPSYEDFFAAQLANNPPRLRDLRDDLPSALVNVIERMIQPNAAKRFPSAADAMALLEREPTRVTGGLALSRLLAELYPDESSVVRGSTPAATASSREPELEAATIADRRALQLVESSDPHAVAISTGVSTRDGSPAVRRARARRSAMLGVGIGALAALAVAALLFRGRLERWRAGPRDQPASRTATAPTRGASGSTPSEVPAAARALSVPAPSVPMEPGAPTAAPVLPIQPGRRDPTNGHRVATGSVGAARALAATSAAAAPAASTGMVHVVALPWGEVSIDGVARGLAPIHARLPAGEHTVRITGGVERTRQVTVTAGGSETVSASAD